MATRIERCYTDNIYLIESIPPNDNLPFERVYVIMGHSGHVYNVTINNHPKCTCPDYVQRKNRCKHIYFVLMRIMNIDNYSDKSYTDEELEEMFLNIPPVAKNLMYEGEKPKEEKEVDQKFEKGDICPICLDPLENGKDLDFCRFSCGKTIHKKCFSMWERTKGSICVFCRAQWYSDIYVKNPKKVSMHPIEPNTNNIIIDYNDNNNEREEKKENNDDKNSNNNNNVINIEDDNDDNQMDLDEDTTIKEKNKKKKNRNKNRSRSRDKSKSKSKSKDSIHKKKNKKKKYMYPKD